MLILARRRCECPGQRRFRAPAGTVARRREARLDATTQIAQTRLDARFHRAIAPLPKKAAA
jgi:hypothetical protein